MNGLVAGTVVEGSITKAMFMKFLEFTVVHTINLGLVIQIIIFIQLSKYTVYLGSLRVLVIDNVKIHYGDEILELVNHFGTVIT